MMLWINSKYLVGVSIIALAGLTIFVAGCQDRDPGLAGTHDLAPERIFDDQYKVTFSLGGVTQILNPDNSLGTVSTTHYEDVHPDHKVMSIRVCPEGQGNCSLTGFWFNVPISAIGQPQTYPVRWMTGDLESDRNNWVEFWMDPMMAEGLWDMRDKSTVTGTFTVDELGSRFSNSEPFFVGSFSVEIEGFQAKGPVGNGPRTRSLVLDCRDFRVCGRE